MSMIQDNILRLKDNISLICCRLGRNPDEITLVAVTKYVDIERIKEALNLGISDLGENKVQEGLKKYQGSEFQPPKITRHMIGHLQTNKVKSTLEVFDFIQSVDSFRLAQEIDKQSLKLDKKTRILVQVNTSGEEQKFGVPRGNAYSLVEKIIDLKNVQLQGLMTIAPWTEDKIIIRDCFKRLSELREKISNQLCRDEHAEMKFLSMGMSDDYEIALEQGSNMIRIGRAVFS